MAYIQEKALFYVNSRNRASGTDSNFSHRLDVDSRVDYDKVVILDCSIPKSFYIVREGYNTFVLKEDTNEVVITVPIGNYNRMSLRIAIQSLLNSLSPGTFAYTLTNQNINQTVDTGKYIFTVTDNSSIQPELIFTDGMYEQLGFDANSTNTFINDSLQSTNVINLNPESTLFLRSNICDQASTEILQNIITTQDSSFSYITFQNKSVGEYAKNFVRTKSNMYTFRLTDEDGKDIDLNGLNLLFTLMLYKSNKTNDLIKKYIKMKALD